MSKLLQVLVCGTGGDSHALAGICASSKEIETSVFVLESEDAQKWNEALGKDGITVLTYDPDSNSIEVKGKPKCITSEVKECTPGAKVILLAIPVWQQEDYLRALEPYVEPNSIIVGFPGYSGFELLVTHLLKNKAKKCVILNLESAPYACRIKEFGSKVQILGVKEEVGVSVVIDRSKPANEPLKTLQKLLGEQPYLKVTGNFLEPYLATRAYVQPVLMYSKWKEWDGKPLSDKPFLYKDLDDATAKLLNQVGDEVLATAKALAEKSGGKLDASHVKSLFEGYMEEFEDCIDDTSSLLSALRTNSAYANQRHPMVSAEDGGFEPNFDYSYLSEDVPLTVVLIRGLATLAKVPTPALDKVITWSQSKLGKEFLVGSELTGKDLGSARAPQSYGFTKLDDLFDLL